MDTLPKVGDIVKLNPETEWLSMYRNHMLNLRLKVIGIDMKNQRIFLETINGCFPDGTTTANTSDLDYIILTDLEVIIFT